MERIALLSGAIKDVDSLVRLQYMDDEIELPSSLVCVVNLCSRDTSFHIILNVNGVFMATSLQDGGWYLKLKTSYYVWNFCVEAWVEGIPRKVYGIVHCVHMGWNPTSQHQ